MIPRKAACNMERPQPWLLPCRRSRPTKDRFRTASEPSTEAFVRVTPRNASTSHRNADPMGSSPMKARTLSAVSRRRRRPRFSEATKPESPSASSPKRRR